MKRVPEPNYRLAKGFVDNSCRTLRDQKVVGKELAERGGGSFTAWKNWPEEVPEREEPALLRGSDGLHLTVTFVWLATKAAMSRCKISRRQRSLHAQRAEGRVSGAGRPPDHAQHV